MCIRAAASTTLTLAALACLAAPALAAWPSNGRALCTATGEQSYPALHPDGADGAFVVWEDRRGTNADIYAQRVNASGAIAGGWPANGRALCTATADQLVPVIAPDGNGGAFVAWEDYRAGGADPNIYVQRVTSAGAIFPGWPANGVAICTHAAVQGRPTIVSDGAGGAIIAWEDFRDGTGNVYAQRVSGAGERAWDLNGIPLTEAGGDQRFPVAVADGVGGAIVAWEDTRAGDSDIYAQRVGGNGGTPWTTDGVALCAATYDQIGLRVTSDGTGGAIATWEDYRAGNSDIYAQRIDGAGAVKWGAGGAALCTDLFEQYSATIAPDGAGGAFVAWNDLRSGLEDIYVQHVTGPGAIAAGWAADGRAACSALGSQFDPKIATDTAGGVFLTWIDNRPGAAQFDLYGQHLTASGAPASGWPADGMGLCTSANDQTVTGLVPDGSGGAVAAWYDMRSGNADIYALRFNAAGSTPIVDVPFGEVSSFELFPAAPNPLSTRTWLRFRLAAPERVLAEIIDVTGRRVRKLMDAPLPAGDQVVLWDGRDASGAPVPVGVYLLTLTAGAESRSSKLAVIR